MAEMGEAVANKRISRTHLGPKPLTICEPERIRCSPNISYPQKKANVANIGEPQRIIIAEPVFEPVPQREPQIDQPLAVPEPEEVPAE